MITICDPSKAASQLCITCKWWVEWSGEDYERGEMTRRMGNCVKRSPRVVTIHDQSGRERTRTKWPSTAHDNFCGDHLWRQPTAPKAQRNPNSPSHNE